MIYSALTLLFVLALVSVNALSIPNYNSYTFEDFEIAFGKSYSCEGARETARANFNANLAKVKAHNAQPGITYTMGINDKSDLTEKELIARYTGYSKQMSRSMFTGAKLAEFQRSSITLPDSIDWRTQNAVTPVKDQGSCGSCWAFSATESIESQVIIQTGKTLILSPQDVVNCTPNPQHCGGTGGCAGATAELAFEWAKDGIALDSTVPYKAKDGTCQTSISRAAKVDEYVKLIENNATDLLQAVATIGPISVSVDANSWGGYQAGIFSCNAASDTDINHAVQLVGYGTENGTDYWLVRNSWGSSWGEKGYIRLYRGSKEGCGIDKTPSDGSGCTGGPSQVTTCGSCGIWYDNSVPTKVSLINSFESA